MSVLRLISDFFIPIQFMYSLHKIRFYGISVLREQGVPKETIMTYTDQRTKEMVHHYDKSRQFGAYRDDEKVLNLLA